MDKIFSLGIDFGTSSVRAIVLDLQTGMEIASASHNYKSGEQGVILSKIDKRLARQNPADYLESMQIAVAAAIGAAKKNGMDVSCIKGIGVDATASTPIPLDKSLTPLCFSKKFKNNLNAYAWLWKDHTAVKEALEITSLAASIRPEYLKKCGGTYSSEWFFSKILKCAKDDRGVFDAAYTWVEQSDYIPLVLCGINDIKFLKRNVCAAGHKAMYNKAWGGLPDKEFLKQLSPELGELRDRLYNDAYTFETAAGKLSEEWALKFGLNAGIPVAVGSIDAHVGAIGAGVGRETYVQVIGTSTCDLMVFPNTGKVDDIIGVSGVVDGSVLPGYIGIEAGQSAVGDLLNWFVNKVLRREDSYHKVLTENAARLKAGQSGLLALDWNNGNRNVLADMNLTGLILGQTVNTRDFEIYRALIEATAFGALKIIERIEDYGIKINRIINCGGIAHKNPLFMQIYANVINRPMEISESEETVALGAALMGAYTALKGMPGYETVEEIQKRVCRIKKEIYYPEPGEVAVYSDLYKMYNALHDSFGIKRVNNELYGIMKMLLAAKSNPDA